MEEVEVLHANPQYAHVLLPSGIESTVSIQDFTPLGSSPDSHVEKLPLPYNASTAAPPAPTASASTTSASSPPADEVGTVQDEPVVFLNQFSEEMCTTGVPMKEVRVRKPRRHLIEVC